LIEAIPADGLPDQSRKESAIPERMAGWCRDSLSKGSGFWNSACDVGPFGRSSNGPEERASPPRVVLRHAAPQRQDIQAIWLPRSRHGASASAPAFIPFEPEIALVAAGALRVAHRARTGRIDSRSVDRSRRAAPWACARSRSPTEEYVGVVQALLHGDTVEWIGRTSLQDPIPQSRA
jgi:hypothetical protein